MPETPADKYDIVAPLKAAGFTHHIAVPVVLPYGMRNGFTFATRAPSGFSDQDVAVLRSIFPPLAALQEILATRRVMREVVRMYVGEEPHLRILSGDVRRGDVLRIRAAILFADMRDFTGLFGDVRLRHFADIDVNTQDVRFWAPPYQTRLNIESARAAGIGGNVGEPLPANGSRLG